MTSMLEQERAEALDLVVDAILAERPPIDAGVDREHGLVEPERAVDLTGKFARMSHSCRVRSRWSWARIFSATWRRALIFRRIDRHGSSGVHHLTEWAIREFDRRH